MEPWNERRALRVSRSCKRAKVKGSAEISSRRPGSGRATEGFDADSFEMKTLPEFKTEDAERKFWTNADSMDYVDWESGKRKKLVQLKPSLKTISLRLPVSMIEDLKVLANRRDVPYQSLLKVFLAERLLRERESPRS
jgi:predicted DNA binding CopG/RHH family protein